MFSRPHHFQASDRYWAEQLHLTSKFDVHHNWGLRGIEVDTDALRNYRFEVHRLAAWIRAVEVAPRIYSAAVGL